MDVYTEIYDETNRRAREFYRERRRYPNPAEWNDIWQKVRDERFGNSSAVTEYSKRQYAKIV